MTRPRLRLKPRQGFRSGEARDRTLSRFAGTALPTNLAHADPSSRREVTAEAWIDYGALRFCPACVAAESGRWPLAWPLPWACSSLVHKCYLAPPVPFAASRYGASEVNLARGARGRATQGSAALT
ncbi:TniQ family protein [Kitasatospora cheerisanensis]|uniref:TniQ family protein n=1 Tax=Kitasatospora cheerisanensis TaxID=81942 RepID=UPI003CC6D3F6